MSFTSQKQESLKSKEALPKVVKLESTKPELKQHKSMQLMRTNTTKEKNLDRSKNHEEDLCSDSSARISSASAMSAAAQQKVDDMLTGKGGRDRRRTMMTKQSTIHMDLVPGAENSDALSNFSGQKRKNHYSKKKHSKKLKQNSLMVGDDKIAANKF